MMKLKSLFAMLCASSALLAQQPWRNNELDIETRVKMLLSDLTVSEKLSMMTNESKAVARLGIPEYNWWNECLHGIARNGRATVFPQAIALAATFDDSLHYNVADAISTEARVKFNIAQKMGNYSQYAGLTFWTPNVNIFRDPRWGRGQETYGEDPYLTSRMGIAFVKGLQGNDPVYLKTAACAKHYVVHSGPEALRHEFDVNPSKQDFTETYLPAFKALVQDAKVEAVMCAYNRVWGEPCCGSPYLLQDVLRKQLGFKGHIVSDCGALQDFYQGHNVVNTVEDAAILGLKSGVNVNCGNTYIALEKALANKKVTLSQIDSGLAPLLRTRFKLGMFDAADLTPWGKLPESLLHCQKHQDLAYQAAAKSIVLLKNNGILPLKKDIRSIYVVGPNATSGEVLLGNYYGVTDKFTTILEGIVGKVSAGTTVQYKYGQLADRDNVNPIDWTTGEAHSYDAIIACMGISGLFEGEEGESLASATKGDRTETLQLPQNQIDYLKKLRSKGSKPIILVINGGSPIALGEVADLVDAIVFAWYPGEAGGTALADILFGDVNPSGRLPITFPKSVKDLPDYATYDMAGRTYRYLSVEPEYPFGFGLSYTSYAYSAMKPSVVKSTINKSFYVDADVSNTGSVSGEEVVQLYISVPKTNFRVPNYSLKDFKRVVLPKGTTKKVRFEITPEMLAVADKDGKPVVLKGKYQIIVGGSSPVNSSNTTKHIACEVTIK